MSRLHFEDIEEGQERELGSYRASRDEMISFAEQFDPQAVHIDESLARDSIYEGIIASGWYTASICMRLLVDGFLSEAETMGSFGLDELRWSNPVRPGDVISVRNTVLSTTASSTRDDRGYVENQVIGRNEQENEVISWGATNIFGRR